MRSILLGAALAASSWLLPAAAQGPDALGWLNKMYTATQRLNYTGTFIYQNGENVETSRITRLVEGHNVYERLETLDGTPREVIRLNDEVKCYLPTTLTIKVDRNQIAKPFPGMLPEQVQSIGDHYVLKKGGIERIAGYDCQVLVLQPKDGMRYGHKLWADVKTGMLVKALTFNEQHGLIEQFFFTDLRIGGRIDRDQVRSRFAATSQDWRIENLAMKEADLSQEGWTIKSLPPGYQKVTERRGKVGAHGGVGQIVLSDGLAAASVFIEPLATRASVPAMGLSRQGAMNVYTRKLDDFLVTVVGELPAEGVRFIANQVEHRKGN